MHCDKQNYISLTLTSILASVTGVRNQGPVLLTWINFDPNIITIKPNIKFGMKLLIHSQTSTVQPLKFDNG